MDASDYDRLFPEVRAALTTDIAYSILLAKEANRVLARNATLDARRAEKRAADDIEQPSALSAGPTDSVPQTDTAPDS